MLTLEGFPLPLLEEHGSGPFNPLDFSNPSLILWTAAVFGVLFFVLAAKVWRPLMATVTKREEKIRDDIARAEGARADAEKLLEANRREMEQAALRTKALLDEAEQRAAKLKGELEAQARSEAEAIMTKARAQIRSEKAQAIQEIRDQVVDLSIEVTKRIAAKSVGREDYVREAEALLPRLRGLN